MRTSLLFAACITASGLGAQHLPCATTEMQNAWFAEHPELKARFDSAQAMAAREDAILFQQGYQQLQARSAAASMYTIPVVFHILHQGGSENISDAQVRDAVDILTRDFNLMNSDTSDVVPAFKSLIGNPQITFVLASKDPSGKCTNGILRHYDENTIWNNTSKNYKYTWPSNRYLNIYVVKSIGSGAAGYTYLPGSGIPGSMDAIVILSTYVGSIGTGQPALSRALTHEVGHWLNLPHTWGNSNQPGVSCGDDGVSDTPVTKGFTSCNLSNASQCNPGIIENMQNYMDYAYCQRMFTLGQAIRMQNALNSSVAGRSTLSSSANLQFTGVTNPLTSCAPLVDISVAGNYTVCAGKPLTLLSFTSNANPTSYVWDAGPNGSLSDPNIPNPTVTFDAIGTLTVTLVASNDAGSDAASVVITVKEPWADVVSTHAESFEATTLPNSWTIYNSGSQGWTRHATVGSEGSASMYVRGEQMPKNSVAILESPAYDFKNNPGATFSYKYAYRRASSSNKDLFIIQASADCGGTWVNIYAPSVAQLAQGSGGTGAALYVPAEQEWKIYDQLANHPLFRPFTDESNVRIRFYFKEDVDGTGYGNRFYLDDVQFSVPVGVNELSRNYGYKAYPSPSQGLINIEYTLSDPAMVNWELVNISGMKVAEGLKTSQTEGTHRIQLNTDDALPAGLYFMNLTIDGATMSRKLLIQ